MRNAGLLLGAALALAAGCRPPAATLARTHPAPVTLQVNGLVRWVDRAAGVVELHVECRPTKIEVWCRDLGRTACETRRVHAAPTTCPADVVTVTTGWGATARTTVTPDGLVTATVDLPRARSQLGNAPGPRNGWRVARGDVTLAWREATDLSSNVAPPPPAPPPIPQRSYRGTMILADLAVLVSAPLVFAWVWDGGHEVGGLLHVAAYLAAGPIVHHLNGNPRSGRSFARRALYPVAGIAAGVLLGSVLGPDCEESGEGDEPCGVETLLAGMAGGLLGIAAAVVHDWFDAHVDATPARITPVVGSDGDRVTLGIGGRF